MYEMKFNGWFRLWLLISALSIMPISWLAYKNFPNENIDAQWVIEGRKVFNWLALDNKGLLREYSDIIKDYKRIGDSKDSPRLAMLGDDDFVNSVERINAINKKYEMMKLKKFLYTPKYFLYWVVFSTFLLSIGYGINWVLQGFRKGN
jgi:hypothetical protein